MAKPAQQQSNQESSETTTTDNTLVCGIIMPIANTAGYPDGHWQNVYEILCETAKNAGFDANLVSFDDDVGIIQNRIVQNIYTNPIVVCDISNRNPNVMFELGMRLAFDKPTIIVKDEKTPYSFDVAPIEHLTYPSDLRYQSINDFKNKLEHKIRDTYTKSQSDQTYTTFLKHFGTFKVAHLEEREVTETQYLAAEMKELKKMIASLYNSTKSLLQDEEYYTNISTSKLSRLSQTIDYNSPVNVSIIDIPHLHSFLTSLGFEPSSVLTNNNSNTIRVVLNSPTRKTGINIRHALDEYCKTYHSA